MAYEFLKRLFGTPKDGEQPKAMTYEELEAAIDSDKELKLVNLAEGGYVAKGKYDDKDTELKGVKSQLEEASKQIQAFKDMDIDGVRKSAADWQQKYEKDTKELNDKLAAQKLASAEEILVAQYRYPSEAARLGVLAMLRKKGFKLDEHDVLVGGKEFIDGLKASDENKAAFVQDTTAATEETQQQATPPVRTPRFTTGLNSGSTEQKNENPFNFGFAHVREPAKNP